jgi:hypothetical protein
MQRSLQVGANIVADDNVKPSTPKLVLVDANTPLTGCAAVSASTFHTCFVTNGGAVHCAGLNDSE